MFAVQGDKTMSFIPENEHLLLMTQSLTYEDPTIFPSLDDYKALYDAGIHSAYFCNTHWALVEKELNEYDWSLIDREVGKLHKAGFRVMVNCFTDAPINFKTDWYVRIQAGFIAGAISMWNEEALEHTEKFYRLMKDRYNDDDTLVVNSWLTDGETIYCLEPAWYDEAALYDYQTKYGSAAVPAYGDPQTEAWLKESYIRLMMRWANILVDNPYKEIWTMLHPAFCTNMYSGGQWIEDILQAYSSIPDVSISHIYYTWTQWSNYYPTMQMWREKYHTQDWGGAEYADGLPLSTPLAIANGLRGQIINPLHPFTKYDKVYPWMVTNIQEALKKWASVLQ
jgi:hypothetical protein